jgi:hypothetical protein
MRHEEDDDDTFEAEEMVWRYRFAHDTGDLETAKGLCGLWKEFEGEDSLHEIAFREPVTAVELAERKQSLTEQLRLIEAQLAWMETVETV